MTGLLCFVLAVLASPFKSKLRLEAARDSSQHYCCSAAPIPKACSVGRSAPGLASQSAGLVHYLGTVGEFAEGELDLRPAGRLTSDALFGFGSTSIVAVMPTTSRTSGGTLSMRTRTGTR